MSETFYSTAALEIEEALCAKGISVTGFSDMIVHTLDEDIQVSGGVTLQRGKYVKAEVTAWVGPL